MAQNPPIVMARGQGWSKNAWEQHLPVIEHAAEKAEQGAQGLGIRFREWKLGTVDRITPEGISYIGGRAIDMHTFLLRIDNRIVRPTLRYDSPLLSRDTLHEVIHCTRFEHTGDESVLELAASEGLAYMADELYRQKYYGKRLVSKFFDFDLDADPQLEARILDNAQQSTYSQDGERAYFTSSVPNWRGGDLYGIQRVKAQLEKGFTISDLISQPAEDVLGL